MAQKRVKFKRTVTITIDDATLADLKRLQEAKGKWAGRRGGASHVIREAIREAARNLGKTS